MAQVVEIKPSKAAKLPREFETYVSEKSKRNGEGGRPHFLQELAKDCDVQNEVLNILELAWIKNKSIGFIARKYHTSYYTIYRLLQDLEPFKEQLTEYLLTVPRRKAFYNRDLDSSDYETVQNYIRRAKRDQLKNYKRTILNAMRCWRALGYKDPARWTAEDVLEYLYTLPVAMQSGMLDAIRQVAPQIANPESPHYIKTGRFREKISRRKKDIFGNEVNMIIEALKAQNLTYHELIFKLHITLGAREGSKDSKSGICGLSWDKFKHNFATVDLYESKVRGGILWCDCPLTLFFKDLPDQLQALWKERGKPITDKLILGGYQELINVYKEIRQALAKYYKGKLDPALFKELTTLRPHDADKIHVNLLWEAEIPLEVVAGQYLGKGEGIGLMGRGWLDINTIKKHYLSLTQRSERFKKLRRQVQEYSNRFNGGHREA